VWLRTDFQTESGGEWNGIAKAESKKKDETRMRLTMDEWLLSAGRRLGQKLGLGLMVIFLLGMLLEGLAHGQAVTTTTVQGTVYLANGQVGTGTLVLSWPAFTTASGQSVAADRTNVTIGPDGFLSVNLAPNLGATPAGLYYTAVYYLSDGTTTTQYWVVPAAAQASLGQVQAQVMPAAQAVQTVSKAYVDQAIAEIAGSQLGANGGTLTGPLYLNGDPTQPLQAADKHYVDETFALAVPIAGGNMTGPLQTPAVNGVESPVAGSAQTTLQAAITAAGTTGAMEIPPTYAGSDTFTNPNGVMVTDLRTSGAQQTARSVKEFGAVCNGTTDDTNALQAALNYANTHGVALTIPQGTCKTRSLNWHGESIGGLGKQVSVLMGFPGQDVLASVTDSTSLLQYTRIHDLTIYVDQSQDISCTPAEGRAAAGGCGVARPVESNSIFSPGGNGLTGTAGTGAGWSVGNCAIAMPAVTGNGGNGLRVAEIENVEFAATGVDPLAAQYPGIHSTHTCGLYLAQWPQWSDFRNIDIRGLNTGIAIPALAGSVPAGLNSDSNRWQNITINATHAFTVAAGSNNVLDNVISVAGNSAASAEPPTGLVLDLPGTNYGWTVRNAVVLPTWTAVQPQLTVTASGGAVTGVTVGPELGLGFDPYGATVPLTFSGSCTAHATANVNSNGSIGTISVTAGGVGCSGSTTASVNAAGTWDTAAAVNLIGGQNMAFFAGNLLKGQGGYTVWNAASSGSYGTQVDGGGGTKPGGGSYAALVASTSVGSAFQVDQFPGADFGAKVQACLGAVSATYGGTCDARNFTGSLSMGSNLTISKGNATILLPCATITTANQIVVTAGTRNVALRGCALRGGSAASGSQGGTAFAYSGAGAMVQVGDPTYAADTPGFHMDNVAINTTAATSGAAKGLVAYRTQELDLESLYFLGNSNQTGLTLDGTGNYTGGTFLDNQFTGFQTAVNAIGHQVSNPATTDWMNASSFVRVHIDCPTSGGSPIAGTFGINLQQGDGNTFTGGDVEGCTTALHLGANAQNNTIVGLRNENSTSQVVADTGSAYNNWITGGTMFTGQLTDNGTRNSFLDTFHRSFNGMKGDWYGSQQDATVTNHYRLGIGLGNERGMLNEIQTDYGYRWLEGFSDATAGQQLYQIEDLLNGVNRISIGQYNNGQSSTNNQTVINSAGTGAVVLNGSTNSGTGGVVIGSGGSTEATVATVSNAGNAQFNGTLLVGGTSQSTGTMTVRNNADAEVDYYLWPGLTASQKGSYTYKDWNGNSQWYMVKDASNNWALNSAVGGLDSFKAYQSTNSGDTYVNASNSSGTVRVNYETGSGSVFNVYGGSSSSLYASFSATNAIKFPGLATSAGHNCLQIDNSGFITNTGTTCGTGSLNGTVTVGTSGQIAYYDGSGTVIGGINTVPISQGGTGATTGVGAIAALGIAQTGSGVPSATCNSTTNNGSFYTSASLNLYQCSNVTGSYAWNAVGGGSISVSAGSTGQIAYYTGSGTAIAGESAVPVGSGGTGASTASAGLANLGGAALAGATFTGPVNAATLEGTLYADQQQSGAGNNGIANSLTACASHLYACSIVAPALYSQVEAQPWGGFYASFSGYPTTGPTSSQPLGMVLDQRYGVPQWFINGSQPSDGRHNMPPAISMNQITIPQGINAEGTPALQLQDFYYAGGRNTPNYGSVANGDKTNISSLQLNTWKYTQAQTGGDFAQNSNCFGNGDCVGHDLETISFGGPSTAADEGNESMRYMAYEQGVVFGATLSSISAGGDGSETIATTSQVNNQTQGEDRLLIDLSQKYNAGYVSSIANSGGNVTVSCTGCNWGGIHGNSTQTTLTAAIANPSQTNSFPQSNVSLQVGSSIGFNTGNLACIFDFNYECEKITAVGTGTITIATDRMPHPTGAYVTTGGLAGYAWEAEADRVVPGATNGVSQPVDSALNSTIRYALPIMMSSGNTLTLMQGYNMMPGQAGGYNGRAYTSMGSGGTVALNVSGGVVTSCTASGGSGYGGSNAPPQVAISGSWTTAPVVTAYGYGALSTCQVVTGGSGISGTPTATVNPTNAYDIYPATKVYSVYNASAGKVDGTFYTEPVAGTFAVNDAVEEPHYFLQRTNGATNGVGQYIPAQSSEPHYGLSYNLGGIWENSDFATAFSNGSAISVYAGNPSSAPWNAGSGQLIAPSGHRLSGAFSTGLSMDTPPFGYGEYNYLGTGAVQVGCGTPGCSNWKQSYNFLNGSNGLGGGAAGQDVLSYNPSNQNWQLTAGGTSTNGSAPSSTLGLSPSGVSISSPISSMATLIGSGQGVNASMFAGSSVGAQIDNACASFGGNNGVVIVPYGMGAGSSIVGLPAKCHLIDYRGNSAPEIYGGLSGNFFNSILLQNAESTPASATTYNAFVHEQLAYEGKSGGAYTFNGSSGEKSNYINLLLTSEDRTVGEKYGAQDHMWSTSGGDTIPLDIYTTQFGGYLEAGDEQTVGIEDSLQQGSASTTGTGGVAVGTITAINSGTGVVSFTASHDENTMGEARFIRDLGTKYSSGSYSGVSCTGSMPTTCTVSGSGTAWSSIPGFVGTHTTWNSLSGGGPVLTNNLVFCPTPAANDGYDWCVPITQGVSDTSFTVNLYATGSQENSGWPAAFATSGSYSIYRSAFPTAVDVVGNSFTSGDVSGLTVGHSFDQVLAYNMETVGLRVEMNRHIGMPYQGIGVDIQNQSDAGAPSMNSAVNVTGNFQNLISMTGAPGATPSDFLYTTSDFTGPLFQLWSGASTPINFIDYLDSTGAQQSPLTINRNASSGAGTYMYGNSFSVSPNGWVGQGVSPQPNNGYTMYYTSGSENGLNITPTTAPGSGVFPLQVGMGAGVPALYVKGLGGTGSGTVEVGVNNGQKLNFYSGNGSGNTASINASTGVGTFSSLVVSGAASSSGNNCLQISAGGVISNSGAACSGSSGTVSPGTAGQIAYYSANGTTVSGATGAQIASILGSTSVASATLAQTAGSVANPLTMDASGSGVAPGSTYNGSAAMGLSYNTLGAAPAASPTFTGTVTTPLTTAGVVTTTSGGVLGSEAQVTASQGGTGVSSLSGVAYGNGSSAFTAATGAQIAAAIGTTAVANATNAVNAANATTATTATSAATAGSVSNAITLSNGGTGAASGTSFNGSSAVTLSYNSLGAAPVASPTFTGTVTTPLTTAGLVTATSAGVLGSEGQVTAAQGGTGINTASSTGLAQVSSGTWSVSATLPASTAVNGCATAGVATTTSGGVLGCSAAPTVSAANMTSFPTLNQNTTGTAGNITAASNSTLTTLSALSLPYSQVTGTPTLGTAALQNTGTSGAALPLLNGTSTWSGVNSWANNAASPYYQIIEPGTTGTPENGGLELASAAGVAEWYLEEDTSYDLLLFDAGASTPMSILTGYAGAATNLSSQGTGAVTINNINHSGSGGFSVYEGGANYNTLAFNVTSSGNASATGTMTASSFSGAGTGLTGTAASLTAGGASNLAGGALGSSPYQSAANTTSYLASPTTSGHTFVHAWQPTGSAIAPIALDLATYLASPPAIGGTAAAAANHTTLGVSGLGTFSANGAASTAGLLVSGTPYTAGTATTNFPQLSIWTAGATGPSSWSTAGTMLGINAPSGFAGNIFDAHLNGGASSINMTISGSGGNVITSNVVQAGNALKSGHGIGTLNAGTVAAGAAAGSSPTIACATSHLCSESSGTVSLTTGTSTTTGALLTITTASSFAHTNLPDCTASIVLTASPYTATTNYLFSYTTSVWTLNVGSALTASTAYTVTYHCLGY
jgi:hypothetical protein